MSISKKTERGECPFALFEPCNPKCALYRKGMRFSEKGDADPIPFEDCVINIIADNLEAMHNRTYMMQQEVGDMKNITALKTMVDLRMHQPEHVDNLKRHVMKVVNPPRSKKEIEG